MSRWHYDDRKQVMCLDRREKSTHAEQLVWKLRVCAYYSFYGITSICTYNAYILNWFYHCPTWKVVFTFVLHFGPEGETRWRFSDELSSFLRIVVSLLFRKGNMVFTAVEQVNVLDKLQIAERILYRCRRDVVFTLLGTTADGRSRSIIFTLHETKGTQHKRRKKRDKTWREWNDQGHFKTKNKTKETDAHFYFTAKTR